MKLNRKGLLLILTLGLLVSFSSLTLVHASNVVYGVGRWEIPIYTAYVFEPEYEYRTWKLVRKVPGFDQEFEAAFVGIAGLKSSRTTQYITFITPEGEKRALPINLFSLEDQRYAQAINAEMRLEREKLKQSIDFGSYISKPNLIQELESEPLGAEPAPWDWNPTPDEVTLDFSDYFRFIWGHDTNRSGRRWFDKDYREMNKEYLDAIFEFAVVEMDFPQPYEDEDTRYKIDVTILGTGIGEGWAFGGEALWINADAMFEGSWITTHEYGHALQFYAGGMKNDDFSGWYFETHANWFAHQFSPSDTPALEVYPDRANHHLSSTRFNYGSWPFIQYITEHPRLGPDYPNYVWTKSLRRNSHLPMRQHGGTLEDPLQFFMRYGYEQGVFLDPVKDFGDLIGEMAARNVTWDYVFRHTYQNNVPVTRYTHLVLEKVPDKEGWYRPPYLLAPQQYGYNIVELVVDEGASKIEVNFQGIQTDEGSDWRATIVVVDKDGRVRYSRMWNYGVCSIDLTENDEKVYLAVAATPSVYEPVNAKAGYRSIITYPYEISVVGATPAAVPAGHGVPVNVSGTRHPNGGGFVASTAVVEDSVYVAENAAVLGLARVTGNARIEDYAIVRDSARISDNAVISGNSVIRDRVSVSGNAIVRNAELRGDVKVTDNAKVLDYIYVSGRGVVSDHALLVGRGTVNTTHDNGNVEISGDTIIGINSEWKAYSKNPILGGIYYELTENVDSLAIYPTYLYAHYEFDEASFDIVRDQVYYHDGVLRGGPRFVVDEERTAIKLNGINQYVVLNRDIAEMNEISLDMWIKWEEESMNQKVFDFGSDVENRIYFTPKNAHGVAEFAIVHNGVKKAIVYNEPLPVGEWVRVIAILGEEYAALFIAGEEVGTINDVNVRPVELKATANYLGRGQEINSYFKGYIDRVKVYSKAIPVTENWFTKLQRPFQTAIVSRGQTQEVNVRVDKADGAWLPGPVYINYGDGWKEMNMTRAGKDFFVYTYRWIVEEQGRIKYEIKATDFFGTPGTEATVTGSYTAL